MPIHPEAKEILRLHVEGAPQAAAAEGSGSVYSLEVMDKQEAQCVDLVTVLTDGKGDWQGDRMNKLMKGRQPGQLVLHMMNVTLGSECFVGERKPTSSTSTRLCGCIQLCGLTPPVIPGHGQ